MVDTVEEMQRIVEDEASRSNVQIRRWSQSSCGTAFWDTNEVKIPKPVDFDTLGVCFHEFGHVVLGHCGKTLAYKPVYVQEYEAEQYAILKLKEHGCYNRRYEIGAKAHVLMKIAQAKNRGHNMRDVPKEIVDWVELLQVNKWNAAKKVWVGGGNGSSCKKMEDINIQLYN